MNMKKEVIASIAVIGLIAGAGFYFPVDGLFENHLKDARGSIAINDIDRAIASYKLYIQTNLDDEIVRREYIDLIKKQIDPNDAIALESTFLRKFPTKENFKLYDDYVESLIINEGIEADNFLQKGNLKSFEKSRRAQQELFQYFSPITHSKLNPSDYQFSAYIGPRVDSVSGLGDLRYLWGLEGIIEGVLNLEFNIIREVLRSGDNSYLLNLIETDTFVDSIDNRFGYKVWVNLMVSHYGAEIAGAYARDLVSEKKYEEALELLQICAEQSESTTRGWGVFGVIDKDSPLSTLNLGKVPPKLYRYCQTELANSYAMIGDFDRADSELKELKLTYKQICEECDTELVSYDRSHNSKSVDKLIASWLSVYDASEAHNAFAREEWVRAAQLYREYINLRERYGRYDILNAENVFNEAMAYSNNQQYTKTIALLRSIQKQYPNYRPSRKSLSDHITSAENAKVTYLFKKHFDKGQLAFDKESYSEAVELYRKAIIVAGDNPVKRASKAVAMYNIGQALNLLERYGEAESQFKNLAKDYPDYETDLVQERIKATANAIENKEYWALRNIASEAFDSKSWIVAAAKYAEAEEIAFRVDNKFGAAECAYNSAMAVKNQMSDWSKAIRILKSIQRVYPSYEPAIVRGQIQDMQSSCPNQFLGC
tara:strand:- start:1801 stop:3768 length:1968 start_codon:yes stop_codon:yes gene_type:complete